MYLVQVRAYLRVGRKGAILRKATAQAKCQTDDQDDGQNGEDRPFLRVSDASASSQPPEPWYAMSLIEDE